MKVSAKDLHRLLRESLGAGLEQMGFVARRGSTFEMARKDGGYHLVLWAQVDRYGWEDAWGSRFTVELQWSAQARAAAASMTERKRFAHLLEADELEHVRAHNNAVISTLPGFIAGQVVKHVEPDGFESVIVGYEPSSVPYAKGWDIWLHYASPEHVTAGAELMGRLLPECLHRMQGDMPAA